ncbi:hypothetical protein ACI2IY_05705 [Lysobacter enzymogenes]|uniref:hypothetical protein n=1 Tax=Lysobacter enzymogenes TaxID=69 RepID=UPI00384CAE67
MAWRGIPKVGPCVLLAYINETVNDIAGSSQYGDVTIAGDGTLVCADMDLGYSEGLVVLPLFPVDGKAVRLTPSSVNLPLGGGTSSPKIARVSLCWITKDDSGYYQWQAGSAYADFEIDAQNLPDGGAAIVGLSPAPLMPMRDDGQPGTFGTDGNAVMFHYEEFLA